MNLEGLFGNLKDTVVLMINDKGEIIDFYPKENKYQEIENKISVFSRMLLNMSVDFFSNFFESAKVKEVMIKSDNKNIYLYKIQEKEILCFVSDNIINTAMITLILKNN